MWTVVVEVHLGKKGTVFQVGSFRHSQDAAAFADELEWEIGENRITASIVRSENLFDWLLKMVTARRGQGPKPRDFRSPPCLDLYDELEEV